MDDIEALNLKLEQHIGDCHSRCKVQDQKLIRIIDATEANTIAMKELGKHMKDHVETTQGLVDAWQAGRTLGRFGRWLSGLTIFGVSVGYIVHKLTGT